MTFPNYFSMEKLQNFLKICHSFLFFPSQIPDYKWCHNYMQDKWIKDKTCPVIRNKNLKYFLIPWGGKANPVFKEMLFTSEFLPTQCHVLGHLYHWEMFQQSVPRTGFHPGRAKRGRKCPKPRTCWRGSDRRSVKSNTEILANTVWCQTPGNMQMRIP